MLKNQKDFLKFIDGGQIKALGYFCNEHLEEFCVYQVNLRGREILFYITGDEFNWEPGWSITPSGIVYRPFFLGDDEKARALEIIGKHVK